jgi:transcription termination factor Rho
VATTPTPPGSGATADDEMVLSAVLLSRYLFFLTRRPISASNSHYLQRRVRGLRSLGSRFADLDDPAAVRIERLLRTLNPGNAREVAERIQLTLAPFARTELPTSYVTSDGPVPGAFWEGARRVLVVLAPAIGIGDEIITFPLPSWLKAAGRATEVTVMTAYDGLWDRVAAVDRIVVYDTHSEIVDAISGDGDLERFDVVMVVDFENPDLHEAVALHPGIGRYVEVSLGAQVASAKYYKGFSQPLHRVLVRLLLLLIIPTKRNQMKILELENEPLSKLRGMAKELNIPNSHRLKKETLAVMIREAEAQREGIELRGGILEIMNEGIGFLRATNYRISDQDVYVSQAQLRRHELRAGDLVIGQVRPPRESERHYGLLKVESVNGLDIKEATRRPLFENLTPIFPDKRFDLETDHDTLAPRLINLIAPIGRGQRGLIVSPPKAGKTTILKQIANAISTKYPDVHLIVALIGERPEEVTDMDRSVDAEVVASTFDEPVTAHVRTAELALERAKRLVEIGRHVVIMMDSITRLARAYNLVVNPSGRTLSGGMDPSALYPPKRFFGAARNIEEGGSLTIIATCLVDTGSRLDDVVYEEFKGTGNMELHLSRKLQERRIYPAVDIERSSTRREDLLLGPDLLQRVWLMRRMFTQMTSPPPQGAGMDNAVATEAIVTRLDRARNNQEFLENLGDE